jgi:anti-sigma factor RsiW
MSDHLDDVLSAYVDGALPADQQAAVEAHLAECADCRRDVDALADLRALVHGLPPVDPPAGFVDALLVAGPLPRAARQRRFRLTALNLVAAAVCWGVIVGTALPERLAAVNPRVADFTSAHASMLPLGAGPRAAMDEGAARSFDVPDRIAGSYRLAGFRVVGGTPHAVYVSGDRAVSVFSVRGRLNTAALPAGAEQVTVNGAPAWRVPADQGDVVFVQRGGAVTVIVGASTTDVLPDVADGAAPTVARGDGLLDRAEHAARALLDAFALRG